MRHAAVFCLIMTALAGSIHAETPTDTLLSTRIADEERHYDGAFRRTTRTAVNSLAGFQVASRYSALDWTDDEERTRLLAQSVSAGLPVVVTAELRFPRRNRAELDVQFINAEDGRAILTRNYDFRYRSMPALMAVIEYELSHDLKRQFSEVGRIIRADDHQVYIDLGSHSGLVEGDLHQVYDRRERLTNARGDHYGNLDAPQGLVVIREVSGSFAVADIIFGRRNIQADQWTAKVSEQDTDRHGKVLATLDGEVAVSLGQNSGIQIGDELTINKTVEPIDEDNAFDVELTRVRITEVNRDYALGVILRSNHYHLARGLIQPGDELTEPADNSAQVHINLNRLWLDMTGEQDSVYTVGFRFDSVRNQQIMYRLTSGYLDTVYLAAGVMGAINYSENFYYGLDAVVTGDTLDDIGVNALVSMNAPLPLTDSLRLNTDLGYLVSSNQGYNGLNISIGVSILAPGR